jgi:hypothetical protein
MLDRHEIVELPPDSIVPGPEDLVQFPRCVVDNGVRRVCLHMKHLTLKPGQPPVGLCALFGLRTVAQAVGCEFSS